MIKNPIIYDDFSNNTLEKHWEPYERKFNDTHENGNGVVKENINFEDINILNKGDKKKKCLALEAHGDLYNKSEPKGLKLNPKTNKYIKTNTSKRVGSIIRTKRLLGPGEYYTRFKITDDRILNAFWLFNYEEYDYDDHRHKKDKRYNFKGKLNNTSIINNEIDFEFPGKNKNSVQFNSYITTEDSDLFHEHNIEYSNLNDNKWHELKIVWRTDKIPLVKIIKRELTDDEVILVDRKIYIKDIKDKMFQYLNGMEIIKDYENDNNYSMVYGKKLEYYLDNMETPIFKKEMKEEDFKNFNNSRNDIPVYLSHFYIGVWFSRNDDNRDFDTRKLYVDKFSYKPNEDLFYIL